MIVFFGWIEGEDFADRDVQSVFFLAKLSIISGRFEAIDVLSEFFHEEGKLTAARTDV